MEKDKETGRRTKTLGSGRQMGSLNKKTEDLRTLALPHTAKAIKTLKELLLTGTDSIKLQAATALLDRGYGKPVSVEERKIEQIVKVQHSDMDIAGRAAFLLSKAESTSSGVGEPVSTG